MSLINVLFISAIPNNQLVKIQSINNSKPRFIISGSTNVYSFINSNKIKKQTIKLDLEKNQRINFENTNVIFNQISDADTHSISLNKLEHISSIHNIPIINKPLKILNTSRDKVYDILKDLNSVIIPKTIKFAPLNPQDIEKTISKENFTYPIILRSVGTRGGISMKLIKDKKSLYELYDIALDGSSFYLSQYYNYKEEEKFIKYRIVIIDGEVFIRHVIISEEWMIHAKSKNEKYKDEEFQRLKEFDVLIKDKISNTIEEIYKKIDLDYFGIDCFITKDFKIGIFELNANMNILIGSSEKTKPYVEKIKNAICDMILKKSSICID